MRHPQSIVTVTLPPRFGSVMRCRAFFGAGKGHHVPLGFTQPEAARTLLWSRFCGICSHRCFPEVRVALLPPRNQCPPPPPHKHPPRPLLLCRSLDVSRHWGTVLGMAVLCQWQSSPPWHRSRTALNGTLQMVRNESCSGLQRRELVWELPEQPREKHASASFSPRKLNLSRTALPFPHRWVVRLASHEGVVRHQGSLLSLWLGVLSQTEGQLCLLQGRTLLGRGG